jgi:hypothetical protein
MKNTFEKYSLVIVQYDELMTSISTMLDEKISSISNTTIVEKEEKLLTREQLKNKLNISFPTLHKFMKDGKIPFKKIGKKTYFNYPEILKLINGGKL